MNHGTIVDIGIMPGLTAAGHKCFVAYCIPAKVCIVAATPEKAVELAVDKCKQIFGAKDAFIVDCIANPKEKPPVGPTFTPSNN